MYSADNILELRILESLAYSSNNLENSENFDLGLG